MIADADDDDDGDDGGNDGDNGNQPLNEAMLTIQFLSQFMFFRSNCYEFSPIVQ